MGKRLIITEAEAQQIRNIYGLNKLTNPLEVSGSFTASNCDELHAFQGTGGKVIGNMNVIVRKKIDLLNSKGIKVKPTKVEVVVNGMNVDWTVFFILSDKNWIGFTSRGSGCNNDIEKRAGNDDPPYFNGPESIKAALLNQGKIVDEIEEINQVKHAGGKNSFKQIFYRYTLVDDNVTLNQPPTTKNQNSNDDKFRNFTISSDSPLGLRQKLNTDTKNISIEPKSIKTNFSQGSYNISFQSGSTKIEKISFLFDDISQKNMDDRYSQISQQKHVTLVEKGEVKSSNGKKLWYVLSLVLKQ